MSLNFGSFYVLCMFCFSEYYKRSTFVAILFTSMLPCLDALWTDFGMINNLIFLLDLTTLVFVSFFLCLYMKDCHDTQNPRLLVPVSSVHVMDLQYQFCCGPCFFLYITLSN